MYKRQVLNRLQRGFTVVEILVVITIVSLIVIVSVPYFFRMFNNYRVQSAVSQMQVQFRFARNACVSQKTTYQVLVQNQNGSPANTYLVQKLDTGSSTFVTVQGTSYTLPPAINILTTSTTGPFVFNSRGGCTPSGHIDLQTTATGQQYQLQIRSNGTVTQVKL